MIERLLQTQLQDSLKYYPLVFLTGPRQSGKTTLAKAAFPSFKYVLLENPDTLSLALEDPRLFLSQFKDGVIIDEVQKAPELISYLQGIVDENENAKFVLTGSQNFLISEKISQSLAGRISVLTLLPFSQKELENSKYKITDYHSLIFKGCYPRIYNNNIPPAVFYPDYIQTYIERDVRSLKNIGDLHTFRNFIKLCAGRIGQLMNYSTLAQEIGMSVNTVRSWISVLEASYVLYTLPPYYKNFNKRLVKSPKIYFYDTGLACALLGIRNEQELFAHYLKGGLFENMVINEIAKGFYNQKVQAPLYFFRDSNGREIDCLIEQGEKTIAVEIKSSSTYHPDFHKNLNYWKELSGTNGRQIVVYGGSDALKSKNGEILSWKNFKLF